MLQGILFLYFSIFLIIFSLTFSSSLLLYSLIFFSYRAIIDSGLPSVLESEGWKWREAPPLTDDFNKLINSYRSTPNQANLNAKNCLQVGKISELIHNSVLASVDEDKKSFPLILGGDHCIAIGTISAIAKVNPGTGIVWVSLT